MTRVILKDNLKNRSWLSHAYAAQDNDSFLEYFRTGNKQQITTYTNIFL